MNNSRIEPQAGQYIITRDKHQVQIVSVTPKHAILAIPDDAGNLDYRQISTPMLIALMNPTEEVN